MILDRHTPTAQRRFPKTPVPKLVIHPEVTADEPRRPTDPQSKLLFIGITLQRLADHQLPGINLVQEYPLNQYRRYCSKNTLRANLGAILLFLMFLKAHRQAAA